MARGRAQERALNRPSSWKKQDPDIRRGISNPKMIMDDISDDADASLEKNDERLLAESQKKKKKKKY